MVDTLRTQTRPSGTKTATCGGLQVRPSASLARTPTPEPLNGKMHKSKPAAHGRREILPAVKRGAGAIPQTRVPVVDSMGRPLMPCLAVRARMLMDNGKAKGAWNKLGIFYIRLKEEKKPRNQMLVVGIDPGSKFEGYSVVGTKDTVLNIMSEAPNWVKKAVETRRNMRRARRFRNTRRRPCRFDNRLAGKKHLPPSTRSRWDAKVRVVAQLKKIIPFKTVVVEDVMATTKKGKRWNQSFSPIQQGKEHMYRELGAMGLTVVKKKGTETKELRDKHGLKKKINKSKPVFATHCVDSWVLAASMSGAKRPSTKDLRYLTPLRWHRRQLHRFEPSKGGTRDRYGGTMSLNLKRGTIVRHEKHGICYVGGNQRGRISLHSTSTGQRICLNAKPADLQTLTRIANRSQFLPALKCGVSLGGVR